MDTDPPVARRILKEQVGVQSLVPGWLELSRDLDLQVRVLLFPECAASQGCVCPVQTGWWN